MQVIYLDESSELTQEKIEELIERLRRTGKIVRLSCALFGEEVRDMSRTVERRCGDDTWEPVEFMELTIGDVFRMYEDTGEPVVDQKGHKEWMAAGKPYINKDGIPTIKVHSG